MTRNAACSYDPQQVASWQVAKACGGALGKTVMFKHHSAFLTALLLACPSLPALASNLGDIAFVGYNGDGDDNLAFVTLVPIAGGTEIFLSDNEWNGNPLGSGGSFFDNSESEIKWTAPVGGVPAGTVVLIDGIEAAAPPLSASMGTAAYTSSANVGVGASGEAFFAYVGTSLSPSNFLTAIISGAPSFSGNLTGTGLALGTNAISVGPGTPDVMAYVGPRTGLASFADYLPYLHNPTNWIVEDGTGNQNTNGVPPEVPFDTTSFTTTPASPALAIVLNGPGAATISWTPATPGFTLQEKTSLASGNWSNSPSGPTNPITVPVTLPTQFYRLLKP